MSMWSIVIAAFGFVLTLGVNLAIFAYFMGRMKGNQEAMDSRLKSLESGSNGSSAAQATMVEKMANIERVTALIPELQAGLVRLSAEFGASQTVAAEQRSHLQGDYQALLAAVVAQTPDKPTRRSTISKN